MAPSIIYETETIPETGSATIPDTESETIPYTNSIDPEVQEEPESASKDNSEIIKNFFNERKITSRVKIKEEVCNTV